MDGPLYGVRLLVLTELNQDGSEKVDGKVVRVETPQQVGFDPQISEGQRTELRGGDHLVAAVEEEDTFLGINATFQDAVLGYEAMQLIGGGTLVGTAPDYTGYIPPTLADQATPRAPFKAEIYIAEYEEGSQNQSDVAGYKKITLWNCKGRVPSFTAQDRNFLVPSYSIKSRDNNAQSKPSFTIDSVTNLPPAS